MFTQMSISVVMFTDTTHLCKCRSRYINTPPEGSVAYISNKGRGCGLHMGLQCVAM